MTILKLILGFFTGGGAQGLAAEWRQAQSDRLNAANDAERLAAEERMNRVALRLEAQTRGAATWLPKVMRALFALPFALYINKLVIYDKVLGLGTTDDLSNSLWSICGIIVSFYFLDATVSRIKGR